MAFPDSWAKYFLLSVNLKGGSEIQMGGIVDPNSLEINEGDNPGESMPNSAGGRVWKDSPQEDGEITFDIWPVELDTTSGVGLFQQWNQGTFDTSDPLAGDSAWAAGDNRARDLYRVAILWTNDAAATTAAGATAASTDSLRFYATDCRIISHQSNFSDGVLKTTVTFKYPSFNKAGTTKIGIWQSGDDTALVTLGAYS